MSNRREFLKSAVAVGFPAIVPASVFGQAAPSNKIQVAQIGCGRIARGSEFPGILRNGAVARYVAVCDLDAIRLADAKRTLETAQKAEGIKSYSNYREMLQDPSIDAVCISTPDHWHAQPAMEAALAGKDIYLQKPASLTIQEGRHMADCLKRSGRLLQVGSQQRSEIQFRYACELVRNGRIGKLHRIIIGLPVDPSGDDEPVMPVPPNLNYQEWLGSTPAVPYTEKRVHPQSNDLRSRYDRPGWLRCEQFGAGMITGWGAHHVDIAHWAMDTELSGPLEIEALAQFPQKGLWDVHGAFLVHAQYAKGVDVFISDQYANGLRFVGDDGWIFVTRGKYEKGVGNEALNASNAKILQAEIGTTEIHLHDSPNHDHHLDWLTSIRTRKAPATNAEIGHRSNTACLLGHIAMKLRGPLQWDPAAERFPGNDVANAMLKRPQRAPYGSAAVLAR